MSERFAPLAPDNPLIGEPCPACKIAFKPGDIVFLVALGPGDDPEAQQAARDGRPYNAVALPAHHACATGHSAWPD
jgi:hypothetical protein